MNRAALLIVVLLNCCGCSVDSKSVVLRQKGVTSATEVHSLDEAAFPLAEWLRGGEEENRSLVGRVSPSEMQKRVARHEAYAAKKRRQWTDFLNRREPSDRVFRVIGSIHPVPFEYFVLVRGSEEAGRFYVTGGDGIPAIE